MKIVVDTSAIMAVLLNEPPKEAIIEVTTGAEVIAPMSLPWEIGNALSANVKRRRMTTEKAVEVIQSFRMIDIRLVDVDIEEALHISNEFNIYAYDAYVLCCAQKLKAPLLSLDEEMIALANEIGIVVVEVDDDDD